MAANSRVEELRKRLEREPGSRLFAQYAEELRRAGELTEAVKVCGEGLAKHPGYPSARITLGRSLLDLGSVGEAAAEFAVVLEAAPDNLAASRYLGECLEKQGDTSAALKRYQMALLHSPGDEWMRSRVAALGAEGAPPETGAAGAGGKAAPTGARVGPPPLPQGTGGALAPTAGPREATTVSAGLRREPGRAEATEPKPIPLVAVDDDSFELESAQESVAALTRSAPSEAAPAGRVTSVTDDEEFELETSGPPPVAAGVRELTFRPLPMDEMDGLLGAGRVEQDAGELPPIRALERASGGAELASPTLAELYLKQGAVERAVAMYEDLVKADPSSKAHAEGLARARARLPVSSRASRVKVERTVKRLEGALASVRLARQRASSPR